LGQASANDHTVDGMGEAQLGLPLLGVGVAEIGENVTRAASDRIVGFLHNLNVSLCHNGPSGRKGGNASSNDTLRFLFV
jgi:hypothetical protein